MRERERNEREELRGKREGKSWGWGKINEEGEVDFCRKGMIIIFYFFIRCFWWVSNCSRELTFV